MTFIKGIYEPGARHCWPGESMPGESMPGLSPLAEWALGLSDVQKAKFLEAMRYLLYEHEPETEEEIDAFLRSEGIDAEAVSERGRQMAREFLARAKAE